MCTGVYAAPGDEFVIIGDALIVRVPVRRNTSFVSTLGWAHERHR